MKTIVVGLGNPMLTDDAVGLRVVSRLRARLSKTADVTVVADYHGGLRLMERMIGYDRAIVIDAMLTGAAAGTIRLVAPHEVVTRRSRSAHDCSLGAALLVGRGAGVPLPADARIRLVGIEASDVSTFSEVCTPAVESAIEDAVTVVMVTLADAADEPRGRGGGSEAASEGTPVGPGS